MLLFVPAAGIEPALQIVAYICRTACRRLLSYPVAYILTSGADSYILNIFRYLLYNSVVFQPFARWVRGACITTSAPEALAPALSAFPYSSALLSYLVRLSARRPFQGYFLGWKYSENRSYFLRPSILVAVDCRAMLCAKTTTTATH